MKDVMVWLLLTRTLGMTLAMKVIAEESGSKQRVEMKGNSVFNFLKDSLFVDYLGENEACIEKWLKDGGDSFHHPDDKFEDFVKKAEKLSLIHI